MRFLRSDDPTIMHMIIVGACTNARMPTLSKGTADKIGFKLKEAILADVPFRYDPNDIKPNVAFITNEVNYGEQVEACQ